MFKIKLITIGKTKEAWLDVALQEYTKRLSSVATIQWVLVKNLKELERSADSLKPFICLDPQGISCTSEAFSKLLHQELIKRGSRLTLLIGGDEGLPPSLKDKASLLLSLSLLTFTHQMTRLILLEQLYRSFEIARGSPYHK